MDNIINLRRLRREAPDWRELELKYRPNSALGRAYIYKSIVNVLVLSVITFAFLFIVSFAKSVGLQPYTLTAGLYFGLFAAGYYFLSSRGNWQLSIVIFFVASLFPGFIAFLAISRNVALIYIPIRLVAVAALFWFEALVVRHHYYWMLENPRLSPDVRQRRLEWFQKRFHFGFLRKELADLLTRRRASSAPEPVLESRIQTIRAIQAYNKWCIAFFLLMLLIPPLPVPVLSTLVAIFAPLVLVAIRFTVSRQVRLLNASVKATAHSFLNWFTYGDSAQIIPDVFWIFAKLRQIVDTLLRTTDFIPGVFRSPSGRLNRRRLVAAVAFIAIAIIVLPNFAPDLFPSESIDDKILVDIQQAQFQSAGSIATFLYVLFAYIVFPSLGIFSIFLGTAGPLLAVTQQAVEDPDAPEKDTAKSDWQCYVDRVQRSSNSREREHLWLGAHATDDYPILLHRDILSEHAYICGDSGSGKTALGIAPMITQLIRMNHAAIVIIDLKGDMALFQAARIEAEKFGRKFKYFTNELQKATFCFNPFHQTNSQSISLNQVCETILEALNLNHGEGYGRSYFSRVSRHWLSTMLRRRTNIQSFEELYELSQQDAQFASEKERQDAFELIAVIESLAAFEPLNVTLAKRPDQKEAAENAIYMPDVIANKEIVYFWLPSAIETATVREIAKLAMYALLTSAYDRQRAHSNGAPTDQVYLVIDEFQRIASENFKLILEQARSMNVGAILANQTFADLRTRVVDLRHTIQSNTRLKLCFSATDLEQQNSIIQGSGETIGWTHTYTEATQAVQMQEKLVPRISRNNIIEITDDPYMAVCHVVRGKGYSQFSGYPLPLLTSHHISMEEYQRRNRMPWPEQTEGTIKIARAEWAAEVFPNAQQRLAWAQGKEQEPAPAVTESPARTQWIERLEQVRSYLREVDG